MQSPPSRTNMSVREGGLCIMSHDLRKGALLGVSPSRAPFQDTIVGGTRTKQISLTRWLSVCLFRSNWKFAAKIFIRSEGIFDRVSPLSLD